MKLKRTLTTILICQVFLFCSSQSISKSKSLKFKHRAEAALVESEFDLALQNYVKSFRATDLPSIEDLHNAMLAGHKSGNFKRSKKLRKYGKKFNFNSTYLEELKALTSDQYLNAIVDIDNKNRGLCNYNDVLFREMLENDQIIRMKAGISKNHSYQVHDTVLAKIKAVDSINLKLLKNFISNHGFPNKNCRNSIIPFQKNDIEIILRHNLMWGRRIASQTLLKAANENKISGDFVAHYEDYYQTNLVDSEQQVNYGVSSVIILNQTLYIFPLDTEIDAINKNRAKILLEDIGLFHAKVKFQLEHEEFRLVYPLLLPNLKMRGNQLKQYEKEWSDYKIMSIQR